MSLDFGEGVDKVRIRVLLDNSIDVSLVTDEKFKDKVQQAGLSAHTCLAEHGLSLHIEVTLGDSVRTFLLDAGQLGSVFNNMKALQIDPKKIDAFVLSHGHIDHFGGLGKIMDQFSEGTKIIVAKNAFLPKWVLAGDLMGKSVEFNKDRFEQLQKEKKLIQVPDLNIEKFNDQIKNNKLTLIETKDPIQLAPGVWTSGEIEIPIKEELSTGLYVQKNDALIFDDYRDENSIFINVKNKGLIILTGCGHTGIRNTVKMAQKISGIDKIYALIGGYHMNWASKERIDRTIEFLKKINPEILSAMHCSGFKFTARLMDEIADITVMGIVGTEFNL